MDKETNFNGKVALITGAGSGIGAATAILFHKLGASLSITDINEEGLTKTLNACLQISSNSSKPFMQVGDISDEKFQKSIVEETIKVFGQIDILVNNAGIAPSDCLKDGNLSTFDRVIGINLRAPFNLTILTAPHLKKTKGCIVNTSSCVSNNLGNPAMASYGISKAALDKLTKMAASELGSDGIRVNSVNPGAVRTNIFKQTMPDANIDDLCALFASRNAINRFGYPEDISNAIAFLASDSARYITGINMLIDGGFSINYR